VLYRVGGRSSLKGSRVGGSRLTRPGKKPEGQSVMQ
jgi:hypothetical protein